MGFTLAEAVVFFKGDDSQLEKSLDGAEKKTKSAGAEMARFLGGAIVGGATVAAGAILAIGGKAWDVATQIDKATDQIGASLGLGADEAKAYGQTIKDVYGNNFGDSIEDVGIAIENVAKQLKLTADDPALKTMTENAFRLRDVFQVEVSDSVNAANTLMENFGLTGDEAFDLIAAGYKGGLDSSGDFLDTIGEYSVQFAEGGASAGDFFSILSTGLQGGMLGTDKAADLFKEFRVRIQDGSESTAIALNSIGINAVEMGQKLGDGSMTAVEAFEMVQTALWETDNTNLQFQAGVALLGTQFEDLGADAALAINTFDGGFKDLDGAVESLDSKYTNLGGAAEGMWRKFQMGIAPAGEAMLGFVNDNLPAIQTVVDGVSGAVVDFINAIPVAFAEARKAWDEDLGGMRTSAENFMTLDKDFETFWGKVNNSFSEGGESNEESWAEFLANSTNVFTSWVRLTLETLGTFFENWGNTQDAWGAIFTGDWSTFWSSIGANFENAMDGLLNYVEFVFGVNLRDYLVGGMWSSWEALKDLWEDFSDWWANTWGSLVGMAPDIPAIRTPNLPQSNAQQFLDDLNLGVNSSSFSGLQPQAQGATYNFGNIVVPVNAAADPYQAGKDIGRGINDELRARGH